MKYLALCLCLLGCASYEPQLIGPVSNQVQYDKDWVLCQQGAKEYKPGLSFGGLASDTLSGATDKMSLFPVNPLVIPYGAAGGATGSLGRSLDVYSDVRKNVARNCIIEMTHRDESALVANPN